jgi:CTP:molybdopterin cytidylyltransferase MocA
MAPECGADDVTGCAILILAAGASSRMRGGDKLLEEVAGHPLLRIMLKRAVAAARGPVLCALPAPDHPRAACLDGLAVHPVCVPDSAAGMSASIRAGVAAVPQDCGAVMILPADMPEVTADDIALMLSEHATQPDAILRATDSDGMAGHPVIFPADLFPALRALDGDMGARDVLRAQADRIRRVPLPDQHATTDLDTPEAWADWRASR